MNNFLDTTPGSTAATDRAVVLYMPAAEAATVLAICDQFQSQQPELERLRAEVLRLTPDDAHARACRTADIEKLVLLALDNATLRVDLLGESRCRRTKKVRDHLLANPERYGDKVPTLDSVRKVLVKYGYV